MLPASLGGHGRYVDDLTRPGLAHLGVVRSTHAHARIVRVDGKAARTIRGVLAVWTAADVPMLGQPLTTGGSKDRGFVVPLLAGARARYVGEPVAVVLAESPALVADALAAVSVDYAPLPPLVGADNRARRGHACACGLARQRGHPGARQRRRRRSRLCATRTHRGARALPASAAGRDADRVPGRAPRSTTRRAAC